MRSLYVSWQLSMCRSICLRVLELPFVSAFTSLCVMAPLYESCHLFMRQGISYFVMAPFIASWHLSTCHVTSFICVTGHWFVWPWVMWHNSVPWGVYAWFVSSWEGIGMHAQSIHSCLNWIYVTFLGAFQVSIVGSWGHEFVRRHRIVSKCPINIFMHVWPWCVWLDLAWCLERGGVVDVYSEFVCSCVCVFVRRHRLGSTQCVHAYVFDFDSWLELVPWGKRHGGCI